MAFTARFKMIRFQILKLLFQKNTQGTILSDGGGDTEHFHRWFCYDNLKFFWMLRYYYVLHALYEVHILKLCAK